MVPLLPLRQYRERHSLSRQQLGEILGVSRVTVARWETGERRIDQGYLALVATKTGIPPAALRPDLAKLLRVSV